jgi:hypothetical protein
MACSMIRRVFWAILVFYSPLRAAEIPGWWAYDFSVKPQARIEGETKSASIDHAAEGELELARYYGIQGDLPRQVLHLRRFFRLSSTDTTLLCLGWASMADALRAMGSVDGRDNAVREYTKYYSPDLGLSAGVLPPSVLGIWLQIDKGNLKGAARDAEALNRSVESKADPCMLPALGAASVEIAFRESRDTEHPKTVLLDLMQRLGSQSFLNDPSMVVSAVLCDERLFHPLEALQLIDASKSSTSACSPVIPEAELARNELLLCHWEEAARDLSQAHKILSTYPPGVREEARKNLDFAVADYCFSTGHPREALSILERLCIDPLRPGFTTEGEAYYQGGLFLRISMASDRILKLESATVLRAGYRKAFLAIPDLMKLFWTKLKSDLLFREALFSCMRSAYPGKDIGTLVFAPPWLIPEMRNILGNSTFNSVTKSFAPIGRRAQVLDPLLSGIGDQPEDTPPLMHALFLASRSDFSKRLLAWSLCPSSTFLAGTRLPVSSLPEELKPKGWLVNDLEGLVCSVSSKNGANAQLQVQNGQTKRNILTPWPETTPGQFEAINEALINSDPGWNDHRVLSIEGKITSDNPSRSQ